MADGPITIKVDDSRVKQALKRLADNAEDMGAAMGEIAGVMLDAVEENFEQEGRPEPWPDLADSTIEQREKKGYWPGKKLQRTGDLLDSVSSDHDENSAVVGTNKEYAAIHNFGGQAGRGKKVAIPARPFLVLTDADIEEIEEIIIDHLRVD